jgi:hypothetical protein
METYYLFYSNSSIDIASRKFIRELENQYNINVHFKKICIDEKDHNGKRFCNKFLKKYKIKKVPSIIIDSNVYQGQDAFDWLDSQSYSRQAMTTYPNLNKAHHNQQANTLKQYPERIASLEGLAQNQEQFYPQQGQRSQFTIDGQPNQQMYQPTGVGGSQASAASRPIPPELQPISCGKGDKTCDSGPPQINNSQPQFQPMGSQSQPQFQPMGSQSQSQFPPMGNSQPLFGNQQGNVPVYDPNIF